MISSAPPFTVHCPSCSTGFPVDPAKVPDDGIPAICSHCLRVFPVVVPFTLSGDSSMVDSAIGTGSVSFADPDSWEDQERGVDAGMAAPPEPDAEPRGVDRAEEDSGWNATAEGVAEPAFEIDGQGEADLDAGAEREWEAEVDASGRREWEPDAEAGAGTELEADAEPGAGTEWAAEVEPGAETEWGADPGLEIAPEPEHAPEPLAELEGDPAVEPEPGAGAEPRMEAGPDATAELDQADAGTLGVDAGSETTPEAGEVRDASPGSEAAAKLDGDRGGAVLEPPPAPARPDGFEDLTSLISDSSIGSTAEAGTPSLSAGVERFGRRDPQERARHLARVLVSDIIAYYPVRYQESLSRGTLREDFEEEIRKSWKEYVDQVGKEMAESTPYFDDAIEMILGKGEEPS